LPDFDGMSIYPEPDGDQTEMAVNLRRNYVAFLRAGFTNEEAMRLVVAMIGTIRNVTR